MKFVIYSDELKANYMYPEIDGQKVKLYGTIWQGDGPYIVSPLEKLFAKKQPVDIHLHGPGGSVIDGNLIYNAIAATKTVVNMHIDGLAASMLGIVMLPGSKIYMASNAFIMLHAPSGDQRGNAKDFENTAKVLRAMEASFIKRLVTKTGKPEAEIKEMILAGDNWFTAEEALEYGLIDEIVDPVIEDNADIAAFQDLKLSANLFAKYDHPGREENVPNAEIQKITNPKTEEMKLTAESLSALGLSDKATEQEINAAIASKDQKIKDLENKQAADKTARAEKAIADAITAGKILGSEKETWLADANANLEMTERMLAKLPVKKDLSRNESNEPFTVASGREKWSFTDWKKQDLGGLVAMKTKDPEQYKALCDAAGVKF